MLSTAVSLIFSVLVLFSTLDRSSPFSQNQTVNSTEFQQTDPDQVLLVLILESADFQCPACRSFFEQLGHCLQKPEISTELHCLLRIAPQKNETMAFAEYRQVQIKQLTGFFRSLGLYTSIYTLDSQETEMKDPPLSSLVLAHPGYQMVKNWSIPLSKTDLDELQFFLRGNK